MSELIDYLRELNLLQLKYEHLLETTRILLKPWPTKHSATVTEAEKDTSSSAISTENAESNFQSPELGQLDALLNKAQKMRISSENSKKPIADPKKLTKLSVALASSTYKSGSLTSKVLKTDTAPQSRLNKDSRHVASKSAQSRSSGRDKGRISAGINKASASSASAVSKRKLFDSSSIGDEHGFALHNNGMQLVMPSEYTKLKKAVSRCGNVLGEDLTAKAAATHYSKRLLARQSPESMERIHLQLMTEEIEFLKTKLMAVTPFEWTVSTRSSWEDVLSVKTKIDLLLECYHKVLALHNKRNAPCSPSLLGQERDTSAAAGAQEGERGSCKEFGYSSVKDWNTLVDMQLLKSFKQWEDGYLTEIQQTLLPVLSRYIDGAKPCEQERHVVTSMLRAACLVSDIPTKPIYLDTQ